MIAWGAGFVLLAIAAYGVGLYSGLMLRRDRAEDRARDLMPAPLEQAAPPGRNLSPFPGQWALEIEDPASDQTGGWYKPLLKENGVSLP